MLSNDIDRLADGEAQYTLLTNDAGGIVDDLIAYRLAHGQFYLVVNASNRSAVYGWLKEREPRGCEVRDASDEYGLVAVQGPRALERLGLPEAPAFTHAMGERRRDRGDGRPHRLHRRAGSRAVLRGGRRRRPLGRDPRARRHALRARRARHAPPRGLLPAARQRHHAGDGRDLGRARLGVRARHRLHRRRDAPADQGGGPRAQARPLRDGGARSPATGDADRGRRRGHVGDALADARPGHRHGLRAGRRPPRPTPSS